MNDAEQLAALARLHRQFEHDRIEYWLFGGWAVDFYVGSITRAHDDLDIAVWLNNYDRIAEWLIADGWQHAPEPGEDGYTAFQQGPLRLDLAFLVRDEHERVYTPLRQGRVPWPPSAFEDDIKELHGVCARVISLRALMSDKSEVRNDPRVAAKDRIDLDTLSKLE